MQLNYHEGEYLSSLGNTMFGGNCEGADDREIGYRAVGLFYLWHHNSSNSVSLFGSLSQ